MHSIQDSKPYAIDFREKGVLLPGGIMNSLENRDLMQVNRCEKNKQQLHLEGRFTIKFCECNTIYCNVITRMNLLNEHYLKMF